MVCVKKKNNIYIKKNKGVTMVELIVTFALLSIFLVAATMCISHSIIFFYDEQQRMSSYTVADVVLSEIKKDIRTMQAGGEDGCYGYVKLRNGSLGPDINGNIYSGSTIEFVVSNINNGQNAVQIDTAGCNAHMIDGKNEQPRETFNGDTTTDITILQPNYLTMRYYGKMKEDNYLYKDLYMDKMIAGTYAAGLPSFSSVIPGSDVVWHAQEKLPKEMYQNYVIDLSFSVEPINDIKGDRVDYVDVTVYVKKVINETLMETETVYEKTRRIDLQNKVYYNSEPTMYSDR